MTIMTEGLFSHISGKVARVNIFQSCLIPEIPCPFDRIRRRGTDIVKKVSGVKTADVPWDVRVQAGKEPGNLVELFC